MKTACTACCMGCLLIAAVLASQSGCCQTSLVDVGSVFQMPWNEKPDEAPGVAAPYKKIADLRELSKRGAATPADQQEKISHQIAAAIREETDPLVRTEMVRAVGGYSTEVAAAVLRAALQDSDSQVRIAACEIWGNRGGAEAAKLLGELLASDVDVDVRLAAARALGETRERAGVTALAAALEDTDPAMQRRGVESLKKLTGEDLGNDVNRWRAYVKAGAPPQSTSIAERFRRLF